MIMRFVEDPPYIQNAKPGRIDSIGLGLLALWIAALQFMLDRGQEDDWFSSNKIRWAVVLAVIGLIAFLIRELTSRHPLVDLRVFKDRNFALGCMFIALFGAVIYGIITILPLFYQTLLDYSAWAAGLAVSPRGIGAILVMPVVGILSNRIDNRWIMACGFMASESQRGGWRFDAPDLALVAYLADHFKRIGVGDVVCAAVRHLGGDAFAINRSVTRRGCSIYCATWAGAWGSRWSIP